MSALTDSQEQCRLLTRHHAKTFYFSSHTLPRQKRMYAYSVYAFCRYVDDQIDLAPTPEARRLAFTALENVLQAGYSSAGEEINLPWLCAFQETVQRRSIPRAYFQDLLRGVEMDQEAVRIQTWPELENYCYHVASVVGLIMTCVLTEPTPELLEPARHLGTAMQLTNILRDIQEDWEKDRIYLPETELEKFGLHDQDIAAQRVTPSFRAMLRFQIGRARLYYSYAEEGIAQLPNDGSRLTVRLMSRIYGAILDEIERADYQVFRGRVRVSSARKLWLAAGTWLGG